MRSIGSFLVPTVAVCSMNSFSVDHIFLARAFNDVLFVPASASRATLDSL
jgi:hypothetical protein